MAKTPEPAELPIRDEMIRLGQALKLASLVEDGAQARTVIDDGLVKVNGDIEDRRGRQLRDGDVITFNAESVVIRSDS
ncbi:RNA-binding S4 domain-containing protein [Kocuria sp. JC486]|uniref:RNA-binding S4 domain-containing protein n=1 Tax=Kocuria soli TaxID=2485125 RepID=A0A3N3ZXI5_9MICC|nr:MULTISPECIES: RNA-binding S4 domain-containing protein [Kocuria]NHU84929.1 RNA-binding S4 domain-containing protein [Kocuria sp. JC486]ROZ63347.1 RNA-binding S4 domain-containing protein [Kocuria soli]